MPTWGAIVDEFSRSAVERGGSADSDGIRLKYIRQLKALTGRAVIVYASGWLTRSGTEDVGFSVEGSDVHALMQVCSGVEERELDLILHSPGGSPTAAEQMLEYLRTQFARIRVYVPLQAKSAATMMALGCDEVVMGHHSELGPIDPQILVSVPEGLRYAPAHAILRDFDRAKKEVAADVSALAAWTPILRSYAGGMLEFCFQQVELAQDVVAKWLERYMLSEDAAGVPVDERASVARETARYFGSESAYERYRVHGRAIRIEELRTVRGLVVRALEDDDQVQDAVLSIYHALDRTFSTGFAIKIVENHLGARYVRLLQRLVIQQVPAPAPSPPSAPTGPELHAPDARKTQGTPGRGTPARAQRQSKRRRR